MIRLTTFREGARPSQPEGSGSSSLPSDLAAQCQAPFQLHDFTPPERGNTTHFVSVWAPMRTACSLTEILLDDEDVKAEGLTNLKDEICVFWTCSQGGIINIERWEPGECESSCEIDCSKLPFAQVFRDAIQKLAERAEDPTSHIENPSAIMDRMRNTWETCCPEVSSLTDMKDCMRDVRSIMREETLANVKQAEREECRQVIQTYCNARSDLWWQIATLEQYLKPKGDTSLDELRAQVDETDKLLGKAVKAFRHVQLPCLGEQRVAALREARLSEQHSQMIDQVKALISDRPSFCPKEEILQESELINQANWLLAVKEAIPTMHTMIDEMEE